MNQCQCWIALGTNVTSKNNLLRGVRGRVLLIGRQEVPVQSWVLIPYTGFSEGLAVALGRRQGWGGVVLYLCLPEACPAPGLAVYHTFSHYALCLLVVTLVLKGMAECVAHNKGLIDIFFNVYLFLRESEQGRGRKRGGQRI